MMAECLIRCRTAFVICLIWVLGSSGCGTETGEAHSEVAPEFEREGAAVVVPERSSLRARLQFATADRQQVRRSLSVPASVEPDSRRYAQIYPPIAGRLTDLRVKLGDRVKQGQVLASLQSPEFAQAQSEYLKARSTLQIATKNLGRQRDLLAHKIAAQRDVEQAEDEHEAARSDLQSAAEHLRTFGVNPERDRIGGPLRLLAPIDGSVVKLDAALGEFRNDSNAAVMTIADLSTVWLIARMQEKDLRFVKQGQAVRATLPAYPNETFSGTVTTIADVLDDATRTVEIRVAVANQLGRLKPGMFATVELIDFPEALLTVPNTAIVQAGDMTVVYEQTRPWRLEPRPVTLGPRVGERTVVLAGLADGASILARDGVMLLQ